MRRSLAVLSLAILPLAVALSGCGGHGGSTACDEGTRKQDVVAAVSDFYLYPELLPQTFSASAYGTADEVLAALTATARDQGKDRGWSFLMPEDQYVQYFQDAQSVGYGLSLLTTGAPPSLEVFVKQVFAGSGAAEAGFVRGDQILSAGPTGTPLTDVAGLTADGVSALLSAGGVTGVSKDLQVLPAGSTTRETRTMVSGTYGVDPVPSVQVFGTTGYVQLRTFISAAENDLRAAIASFKSQGVQNVVVDLRYNGGGSVDTAALLAELLAGQLDGQPMVDLRFNGNHPDQTAAGQYAFHVQPESGTFQRVAFITTDASASASELVPNVLDAYPGSLQIAYVGGTTYGKPVGQEVFNLSGCNTILFLVSFRLVNANGNVDYFDGLPDAKSNGPLCDASDDLTHPQDSELEASTAAAISFVENGKCPTPPAAAHAFSPARAVDQLSAAARTPVQRDMPGTF